MLSISVSFVHFQCPRKHPVFDSSCLSYKVKKKLTTISFKDIERKKKGVNNKSTKNGIQNEKLSKNEKQ